MMPQKTAHHRFAWTPGLLLPLLLVLGALAAIVAPAHAGVERNVRQLIVGQADSWDANRGRIWLCERSSDREPWRVASGPIPVLFGKNGLVWGRGVRGTDEPGPHKVEKDKRAPAGLFKIGKIYTQDEALPAGADYPFQTVGQWDAWVDDPSLPLYNQYVRVDPNNVPPWFEKQRMRHGDFAYRWRIEIRHNSDPPVAGAGSAIFFHIRRGPDKPSAGCTTMAEKDLVSVIRWLKSGANPHYVLLPAPVYEEKWKSWKLPEPSLLKSP